MEFVFIVDGSPRFTTSFTGSQFWTCGLGGTEASVVTAAEALVGAGHGVTVVPPGNACEVFEGVRYTSAAAVAGQRFDVAILFKSFSPTADRVRVARRIFWPTDAVMGIEGYAPAFAWCDATVYISRFQQEFITTTYGAPVSRAFIVPWAVRIQDYVELSHQRPNQLLYCSVPNRGLCYLAELFPRIRAEVPDATLVITSDFTLWGRDHGTSEYRRNFEGMTGMDYRGRVTRKELVALQQSSRVLAYPCTFPEAFCVAAAECMVAGCVPVTTDRYALQTTVYDGGVLIAADTGTERFASEFVNHAVRLLSDDGTFRRASVRTRTSALNRFQPGTLAMRVLAIVA